jgi:hypothetical protein
MAYDIHIEGVPREEVVNEKFLWFGNFEDKDAIAVQGIQKMVDRFLKCILTPAGTDISDTDYGTQLANLFLGNIDDAGLRQMVTLSVIQAEEQIRRYDVINGAPEDERLATATVESLEVDRASSGFDLTVLLQNTAGTTVLVQLPSIT